MEVYVEKEKEIKKVGSELDSLKEIIDWLEKHDEIDYKGKGTLGKSYERLVNDSHWNDYLLDGPILCGDCSLDGALKEIVEILDKIGY